MLKAYTFSEGNFLKDIHNPAVFNRERELSLEFVAAREARAGELSCPACGGVGTLFTKIENVDYLRCENCASLYAPIEESLWEEYKNFEPLKNYRSSANYQEDAKERRHNFWKDKCFWIHFRALRYLRRSDLSFIDIKNKYEGLKELISSIAICKEYNSFEVLEKARKADIVLYLDNLQCDCRPREVLSGLKELMKKDGLLILSVRNGSGFDILALKGKMESVFPYEHIFLPSVCGLEILLKSVGLEILEISTPGSMDVAHVLSKADHISEPFIKYLFEKGDASALSEFQRFLQKSGMSSYTQIIAKAS